MGWCTTQYCFVQKHSLAASPSPPGRSRAHARRSRVEGGESLANFAVDKIFTGQSNHTETIRNNFIHDSSSCKRAAAGRIGPVRASGRVDLS